MNLASTKNRRGHLRGFTLIELLVVIAIIGILSAVVLAALNTARAKGNDAAIKSNLGTVLTQSAIYYDTNSNYGTANAAWGTGSKCQTASTLFGDPNVTGALSAADTAAGGTGSPESKTFCALNYTAGTWVVMTPLVTNSANAWCVDSTGKSEQMTYSSAAITGCP
jgi:prepilin-type N-terminal cleavage/methylation domain-containing protein